MSSQQPPAYLPAAPTRMGAARSPEAESLATALEETGYTIIPNAMPADLLERMIGEVRAVSGRSVFDPDIGGVPLYGKQTSRGFDLIGKCPSLLEILAMPLVDTAAQAVLFDSCLHPLLTVALSLEISNQGDVPPQPFHRDEETYPAFLPRTPGAPEYMFNVAIAGTDFTAENGGTRLIPGSHKWPRGRAPTADDPIVSLEMKKGDVAVWVGSLYHSAGVNRTDEARLGVILGFVAGWLRTMENQFMLLDADVVARQPARVQQYLGWHSHGTVGMYDWRSPHESLPDVRVPRLESA